MKIYNIYNKNGKLKLSTFDEDKAWVVIDIEAGDTLEFGLEADE